MTNAEARFNKSLRPRKPEGSLGRTAQDVHLDSHTAPELCVHEATVTPPKTVLCIEVSRPVLDTLAKSLKTCANSLTEKCK